MTHGVPMASSLIRLKEFFKNCRGRIFLAKSAEVFSLGVSVGLNRPILMAGQNGEENMKIRTRNGYVWCKATTGIWKKEIHGIVIRPVGSLSVENVSDSYLLLVRKTDQAVWYSLELFSFEEAIRDKLKSFNIDFNEGKKMLHASNKGPP